MFLPHTFLANYRTYEKMGFKKERQLVVNGGEMLFFIFVKLTSNMQ
jgi:hypothetical protein